jgi:hypothetical protein
MTEIPYKDTTAQQAKNWLTCLELGLEVRDELIVWADRLIAQLEDPAIEVIEVSIGKQDPVALLNILGKGGDLEVALRSAMLTARDRLQNDRLNLRAMLSRLIQMICSERDSMPRDIQAFAYWADDEYDLIDQGISSTSIEQFRSNILSELSRLGGEELSI